MVNPLADELASARRAKPCALVIFGATGDLTRRKLVPALCGLAQDGLLPPGFAVIGYARRPLTTEQFHQDLRAGVEEHGRGEPLAAFEELKGAITYLSASFEDQDGYRRLAALLEKIDAERHTRGNRIFYLATPPSAYSEILQNLSESGLSREAKDRFARVIIEKPFGHDLTTARALNEQVAAAFGERQVFRIDHYLGKETVQNILALRFANGMFEPLWNEKYIDHVQLTVAESIGVEGRGAYFEEAGIARDMIQNHLMQVLSLIAMEPPVALNADAVRDEKVKVLRAIPSFQPKDVANATVRGQYQRALVGGVEVPGYREEPGVAPGSRTETHAAVRLVVQNWRWAKTPFFLRAGKRMPHRVTEVAILFKRAPHHLFAKAGGERIDRNVLILRIQPDEGIALGFGSKVPGPDVRIRNVRMEFRYGTAFGGNTGDAYERLLLDAMIGDPTLFARRDEVEEAWRIVDSMIAGWQANQVQPIPYDAGTWGPEQAEALLGHHGAWRRP